MLDDDLMSPPTWFEDQAPPVGIIDDDDAADIADWIDPLADDGSAPRHYAIEQVDVVGDKPPRMIIWQGRQWCATVTGIARRDGTFIIPASELWSAVAIREALAMEHLDVEDLKEALRIGRRIHFIDRSGSAAT